MHLVRNFSILYIYDQSSLIVHIYDLCGDDHFQRRMLLLMICSFRMSSSSLLSISQLYATFEAAHFPIAIPGMFSREQITDVFIPPLSTVSSLYLCGPNSITVFYALVFQLYLLESG